MDSTASCLLVESNSGRMVTFFISTKIEKVDLYMHCYAVSTTFVQYGSAGTGHMFSHRYAVDITSCFLNTASVLVSRQVFAVPQKQHDEVMVNAKQSILEGLSVWSAKVKVCGKLWRPVVLD